MSIEKPRRYVIVGAGAIGGPIAGLLARAGSRVICIARPAYAEALTRGIVLEQNEQRVTVTADAVTSIRDLDPELGDVGIITTKSQATESVVKDLSRVYDKSLPVVCLQNGTRNERIAAETFEEVYAGLVFFSAVQLEPSVIELPQGRAVSIGCYPEGLDDLAWDICVDFNHAGFEASASAFVMAMKWGKLVANLNNATTTITGYWLERAMVDTEMRSLMLEVREEGLRVLDAAGIAVEPPDGEPSPIRIREMTEKLRQPLDPARMRSVQPSEPRTFSSMWQDLYLGRKTNETEYLNGEVIALAKELGIATPFNSTLVETVDRMFKERLQPGLYSPLELHDLVRSRLLKA